MTKLGGPIMAEAHVDIIKARIRLPEPRNSLEASNWRTSKLTALWHRRPFGKRLSSSRPTMARNALGDMGGN